MTNAASSEPAPIATLDGPPLDILQRAGCQIKYRAQAPTPIIITLKPRQGLAQQIERERLSVEPHQGMLEYEDSHGNIVHRFKLREGLNTITYDSLVWVPSTPGKLGRIWPGGAYRTIARQPVALHAAQPLLRFG